MNEKKLYECMGCKKHLNEEQLILHCDYVGSYIIHLDYRCPCGSKEFRVKRDIYINRIPP